MTVVYIQLITGQCGSVAAHIGVLLCCVLFLLMYVYKYLCIHCQLHCAFFRRHIINVILLQDECSFVSLRDIQRLLDVMAWFYQQDLLFTRMMTLEASDSENVSKRERELMWVSESFRQSVIQSFSQYLQLSDWVIEVSFRGEQ